MKPESSSIFRPDLSQTFSLGGAKLDPKYMTVSANGNVHQLTDLTWRFLLALVENAPDMVSYHDLIQTVWEQDHVSDETIAQRLRQVRLALEDDPKSPTYIRTVRGKGYQLIAEIRQNPPKTTRHKVRITKRIFWVALLLGVGLAFATSVVMIKNTPVKTPYETATANPSVSALVSRASEYRNRGQSEANETAISLYEKALEIDDANIAALIGLSFSLSHKTSKYGGSRNWADTAARLADKAIVMSPGNGGAFAARGLADDARGRVSSAIKYYQRSLSLDPTDQSIRSSTAYLLQIQGKYHEALLLEKQALEADVPTYFAEYQIALALDAVGLGRHSDKWLDRAALLKPDNVFLKEYQATAFIKSNQYEEALHILEEAPSLRTAHAKLKATAHLLSGRNAEALETFSKAQDMTQVNGRTCYECIAAFVSFGQSQEEAKIASLIDSASTAIESGDEWPAYRVELAYIRLAKGEADAALRSLNEAYALGYRDWLWLETTPLLKPAHDLPEFEALIENMKRDLKLERDKITSNARLQSLL